MEIGWNFRASQRGGPRRSGVRTAANARGRRVIPRLEALESRKLLNGAGLADAGIGLMAQYFSDTHLTALAFSRVDATVDFAWSGASPGAGAGPQDFSVRWSGQVEARFSETYTFSTVSDDGVRLWVDHHLLVDDWNDHPARKDSGVVSLAAGQKYDIVIEYYENSVPPAVAQLYWSSPSQPWEIVPQSQLFPPPTPPASLAGFVYLDRNHNGVRDSGESGVAQAVVTLTGTNDLGQEVRCMARTAADGAYAFADLRPGTYAVTLTQPSVYAKGAAAAGTAGGTAGPDVVSGITLGAGMHGAGYDFGEIGATLSGTVFLDADGDGARRPGEAGVAGALVTLTGADDRGEAVALTATTAADGSYRFTDLAAGAYTLTVDFRGVPAPAGPAPRPLSVVVKAGASGTGLDFGELIPPQPGSAPMPHPAAAPAPSAGPAPPAHPFPAAALAVATPEEGAAPPPLPPALAPVPAAAAPPLPPAKAPVPTAAAPPPFRGSAAPAPSGGPASRARGKARRARRSPRRLPPSLPPLDSGRRSSPMNERPSSAAGRLRPWTNSFSPLRPEKSISRTLSAAPSVFPRPRHIPRRRPATRPSSTSASSSLRSGSWVRCSPPSARDAPPKKRKVRPPISVKKSAVSAAGLVAGQPTDGPEPVDEQEAVKVADLMLPEAGRSSRNLYDGMTKEKAKILESLFDKYKEMLAKNAERHSSAAGSRGRRR